MYKYKYNSTYYKEKSGNEYVDVSVWLVYFDPPKLNGKIYGEIYFSTEKEAADMCSYLNADNNEAKHVYIDSGREYAVGYYGTDVFRVDGFFKTKEEATKRVHELNQQTKE